MGLLHDRFCSQSMNKRTRRHRRAPQIHGDYVSLECSPSPGVGSKTRPRIQTCLTSENQITDGVRRTARANAGQTSRFMEFVVGEQPTNSSGDCGVEGTGLLKQNFSEETINHTIPTDGGTGCSSRDQEHNSCQVAHFLSQLDVGSEGTREPVLPGSEWV